MPPSEYEPKEPYATHYLVFTGGGAMFEANLQARAHSLQQIASADGTSNTLMVVEAAEPVPWTKPEDLPYSPDQPLQKLGGLFSRGFNVLMADGSVRWCHKEIDEKTIRAMITWNGGEVFNFPE
jgi:prepilin-type processing-associated H-X9-DG protein